MSDNSKHNARKAGRTLLVKLTNEYKSFDNEVFKDLKGLEKTYLTEKTQSYFLTFDTITNSVDAMRKLRKDYGESVKAKFAYYRVFFTMQGLDENSEYNIVKSLHTKLIENKTGANVLYYKLYKKHNNYIECGDLTLDTKEGFDVLMESENGLKSYELENGFSGVHYRFNRRNPKNDFSHQQHLAN